MDSIENTLHQARLLSIQGKRNEALEMYDRAIQESAISLEAASPLERERMERQLSMYKDEAATLRSYIHPSSAVDNDAFATNSESQRMNGASANQQDIPLFDSLGSMFSELGKSIKSIDEQYRISETCGSIAHQVVEGVKEFNTKYEIPQKMESVGNSIKKWDEENHVSASVKSAVSTAAAATSAAVEPLWNSTFSSDSAKPEHSAQPDEVEMDLDKIKKDVDSIVC